MEIEKIGGIEEIQEISYIIPYPNLMNCSILFIKILINCLLLMYPVIAFVNNYKSFIDSGSSEYFSLFIRFLITLQIIMSIFFLRQLDFKINNEKIFMIFFALIIFFFNNFINLANNKEEDNENDDNRMEGLSDEINKINEGGKAMVFD